ncbi:hypothetical protein, partial [Corallococcus sp. CA054B]|uniref:hypothetical protein n=1 Tax=Corallococcus sp. CA054B TaxID=2316734 RepID=UPI001F3DE31D
WMLAHPRTVLFEARQFNWLRSYPSSSSPMEDQPPSCDEGIPQVLVLNSCGQKLNNRRRTQRQAAFSVLNLLKQSGGLFKSSRREDIGYSINILTAL